MSIQSYILPFNAPEIQSALAILINSGIDLSSLSSYSDVVSEVNSLELSATYNKNNIIINGNSIINIETQFASASAIFSENIANIDVSVDTSSFVLILSSVPDNRLLKSTTTGQIDGTGVILTDDNSLSSINDVEITGHSFADTEYDNGNLSGSDIIDWSIKNFQALTLTGNLSASFINPNGPTTLVVRLIQDNVGSRTINWPDSVKWVDGSSPTLTTSASAEDLVSFYFNGINYYGGFSSNFS